MFVRRTALCGVVSGVTGFFVIACLAGCGDGGATAVASLGGGDVGARDEGVPDDPTVPPPGEPTDPPPPPPEDPPPPPADPFTETEPAAGGGPAVDPESEADEPGPRFGELKQLKVEIAFHGAAGETTADADGITYVVGGWESSEDKVYPSEYWGTFQLYFFGDEVGVTVTVTNLGPRRRFSLVVRTEAYVLRTDGSNGAALCAPAETAIEVARGESVTVDASFVAQYAPGVESGLDRLIVQVLHPNVVDNPNGDEPALILQKEAVFCPPEHRPPSGEDAF